MSNIVHLLQDADRKIGDQIADGNADRRIPRLLEKFEDCVAKIAVFRDTVRQSLDASRALLDKLDNTIVAVADPQERSMLQSRARQAREVVRANSNTVSRGLESMTASVLRIRAQVYATVDRGAQAHAGSSGSGREQV
jgi:hypothetical protein